MIARRRQQRRDVDIAMNVVGPAVQKDDRRAIGWAGLRIADIQDTGLDLLQGHERCVRTWLDFGQIRPLRLTRLRMRRTDLNKLGGSKGNGARGCSAEKVAPGRR